MAPKTIAEMIRSPVASMEIARTMKTAVAASDNTPRVRNPRGGNRPMPISFPNGVILPILNGRGGFGQGRMSRCGISWRCAST